MVAGIKVLRSNSIFKHYGTRPSRFVSGGFFSEVGFEIFRRSLFVFFRARSCLMPKSFIRAKFAKSGRMEKFVEGLSRAKMGHLWAYSHAFGQREFVL